MSPEIPSGDPAAQWLERIAALRERDELKGALEECLKGLEALPDSPGLLMAYGELRTEKFNQTKNPEHLKAALISFEKILKANPLHYMANLLAAQIYFRGKVYDRTEEKLASLLKISPADPHVLEVKAALAKVRMEQKQPSGPSGASGQKGKENGGRSPAETQQIDMPGEFEQMINRLSVFSRLEGMRSLHLIGFEGEEIKSQIKSGEYANDFSALVAETFKISAQCARNLGMGNFQRGLIQAPNGNILIVNVFYAALIVVMDPRMELKTVEARIGRYLEAMV